MDEGTPWHALELSHVFEKVTSSQEGLDTSFAKKRLKEYGLNHLEIKSSATIWHIFLRQLNNPIVYLLLFSTLLAFFLARFADGVTVFSIVVLNTIIGFIQESRAHTIIKTLSDMIPHKATVIRDGSQQQILASQVVLGDVVCLQAGDKVAADLRLFFIKNLQCDESTLSGESVAVSKHIEAMNEQTSLAERKCMAFSGTYVTAGMGSGVVVATGLKTEFGKISESIEQIVPLETPLSATFKKIAQWITGCVVVIGASLFGVGYLRGGSLFDSGLAAIALAVAAIPEGLPAVITIASAIGVRRMARRRAIIRQLPAVAALGSTTVICTDKTGTLTHNEMTVQRLWTYSGVSFMTGVGFSLEGQLILLEGQGKKSLTHEEISLLLKATILCSDATLGSPLKGPVGDPTEIALVIAGRKIGLNEELLRSQWVREDVIPFESERRIMATLNLSSSNKRFIFVKGAPEEVIRLCKIEESKKKELIEQVDEMAKEGMRVLAVAEKEIASSLSILTDQEIKEGFTFLGLIGMIDPPRKEVYQAIKACHEAGVSVKMVTGDHPATAKVIGQDLGLLAPDELVITGSKLNELSPNDWKEVAVRHHLFARVSPQHKLQLVEALQGCGNVVAMTGDGVNDAPALKRADIGVAMGIKGTAVAKEASDMILADDNFASIEAAIEEGRRVYDNLIKSLAFILPTSLGQALIVLIAMLFFPIGAQMWLQPILPVQILWINLVVAVALALPLAFEAAEIDVMHRPPRKKTEPVLSGFILFRTLIVSFLMAIGAVGLFLWKYDLELAKGAAEKVAIAEAQTITVTAMMFFQIFYLFHCRSLKSSVLKTPFFSNPSILLGVGVVLLAQCAFIYLPFMNRLFHSSSLNMTAWLIAIGTALALFVAVAFEQLLRRRWSRT